jgi:hypothetical protein
MKKTLSQPAQKMIDHYEHLHIGNKKIRCPYFNNKKTNVRAALRVLVGKGTPKNIEEEALIISLKNKIDLTELDKKTLRTFLIDHNLGIDCSGFVYHVLDAELQATKKSSLKKTLTFPFAKNFIRKSISKLRSVENTNVKTLAHEKNSKKIPLQEIMPGDMITMIGTGQQHDLDHVLLVTEVETTDKKNIPTKITYTHALQWKTDGKYNHGIKSGTITVTNTKKLLITQTWEEDGEKTKEKNETYWRAKTANTLEIRRLI